MAGITPACAGRSSSVRGRALAAWDHPRVCGEKTSSVAKMSVESGSPPRVRGEASATIFLKSKARITPACAGRSVCHLLFLLCIKDHPRVCGEKCQPARRPTATPGSPPRVRGEGGDVVVDKCGHGITPACAGRRPFLHADFEQGEDHPRVCGEKSTAFATRLPCAGSPPRVRGEAMKSVENAS